MAAPPGWQRVFSRSVGSHYYQEKGGSRKSQWEWPSRQEPASSSSAVVPTGEEDALYPAEAARSKETDGIAPLHWDALGRCLEAVRAEVVQSADDVRRILASSPATKAATAFAATVAAEIAACWFGEIRDIVSSMEAPAHVSQLCWLGIVHPALQAALGSALPMQDLLRALDELVQIARVPSRVASEASVGENLSNLPVPTPGADFALFPHQQASTASITEDTSVAVFASLGSRALYGEGIKQRGDGSLWCGYCEVPIQAGGLPKHLNPWNPAAREHGRQRRRKFTCSERLRTEGWKLKYEGIGIAKRLFHCCTCRTAGDWVLVWDHLVTEKHVQARPKDRQLPDGPTVGEASAWDALFASIDEA
eukprot:TRINITY_DN27588_c0_g1_i1.p1 TRINITY_DN27588_c0_g1~~TRINITY_DN27588_c0_g1_i1.p1  ORF type:complete len:413 (+),score=77.68 TRINITY_DN27588_c0_g1_i1:145-1239(+)